jgi:hypothetical protein
MQEDENLRLDFPATGNRHRSGSGKDLTETGDYLKNAG